MSISILKSPQMLSPVKNQIIVVLDSTNKLEDGFTFLCYIYSDNVLVATKSIEPNLDGFGVLDIHNILKNHVTFNYDPTSSGWTKASDSRTTWKLELAEKYRYSFSFYDNSFLSGGKVGFLNATERPLFNINDSISVAQDEGFTNPTYNATTTVTGITFSTVHSAWELQTDIDNTLIVAPAEPGEIFLSDRELSTFASTFSIVDHDAFNGVLSFQDNITWDSSEWIITDAFEPGKWLTNVPNNYEMFDTDRMWLNAYQDTTNGIYDLEVVSNLGTMTVRNTCLDVSIDENRLLQIGVGPWNLMNIGTFSTVGTYPIIDTTTTEYTVTVVNPSSSPNSDTKTFKLRTDCSPFENIQLLFLDNKGSFIPFTFNMVNRHNKNIKRTNYQQIYGSYAPASNDWTYKSYDRGTKNLDTVVTDTYIVNSNWVNQSTSNFLMELFESPEVYWINEDGLSQAINIITNTQERKQILNDHVISYQLSFQLANKNSTQ